VTDRRTRQDWARQIRRLVDEDFPGRRITLVMDNWRKDRNGAKAKVNWRFTSDEARVRLKSLYPEIQCG